MRGILFGLLYQIVVAIGLIWVAGVARGASPAIKANVMLCAAGGVGLLLLAGLYAVRGADFEAISRSDVLQLAAASLLILVIGEALYLYGLAASSATTMAYTALAFPAICLIIEVALRRVPISSLTLRDYAGMALLAVGFALLASRSSP